VAAWCAAAFGDTDGAVESLEQVTNAIPDAYGLTIEQRSRLAELGTRQAALFVDYEAMQQADPETLLEAAGSVEQVTADFLAVEQEGTSLQREMEPHLAPLLDSDLACDLDR